MSKLRSKTTRNSTRKSAKKRTTKRTTKRTAKSTTTSRTKRKTKLTTKLINFIKADKVTTCLIAVVLFLFIAPYVFPADTEGDMAVAVVTLEERVEYALDRYHETIEAESGAGISPSNWWAKPQIRKDLHDSIEAAQALLDRYYNPPTHNLTIGRIAGITSNGTVTVNGSVLAPNVPMAIEAGASVQIIAAPNSGHRFVRWTVVSGGLEIPSPTISNRTFVMPDNDVEITAEFAVQTYYVTVSTSGTGYGTATANPTSATAGTTISLNASPNATTRFVRWEVLNGNVTISNPTGRITSFVMPSRDVMVRAVFEHVQQRKTGSRVVNFTGSMGMNLAARATGWSNILSFNVTNVRSDAKVTSISVDPGRSTSANPPAGTIVPDFLRVTSSSLPDRQLDMEWRGVVNTILNNSSFFTGGDVNALWTVRWYGTNTSSLNSGTRSFNNVSLTINYEYFE
ncbi:MAG: hypothetical protein FWG87_06090 [Defluviitaleaceae bacterium]|nr:hypothetical protein [Defluviitaleaceae bacterium]